MHILHIYFKCLLGGIVAYLYDILFGEIIVSYTTKIQINLKGTAPSWKKQKNAHWILHYMCIEYYYR